MNRILLVVLTVFTLISCSEETTEKEKKEQHNRFEEVENKLYSQLHCAHLDITENGSDYSLTIVDSKEIQDSNNTEQGIATRAFMTFMGYLDEYSFGNFMQMDVEVVTDSNHFSMQFDRDVFNYMSRVENIAFNYNSSIQNADSLSMLKFFNPDQMTPEEAIELAEGYKEITKQLGNVSEFELTGIYFEDPQNPLQSSTVTVKGESSVGGSVLYHEFRLNPKDETSKINWVNYTIGQMYLGY